MKYTLVGQLPRHLYVWVNMEFTHKKPVGWVPAVWFGLVSYPGRMWGCTVMLESGAVYRNLPPHAITFAKGVTGHQYDSQTWDCYGTDFAVIEYDYLAGLRCRVKRDTGEDDRGEYLFTAAPVGDAFSAAPDQAKEFSFIALNSGRLTIQPTNLVLFEEKSFTVAGDWPTYLRRQTEKWTVE